MKDLDRVTLTYNDSKHPDRIFVDIEDRVVSGVRSGVATLNLSPADAVALADRLLSAVRSEGYTLTAKHRNAR